MKTDTSLASRPDRRQKGFLCLNNPNFPSDFIPIICDIYYKNNKTIYFCQRIFTKKFHSSFLFNNLSDYFNDSMHDTERGDLLDGAQVNIEFPKPIQTSLETTPGE